jgi:lycopene cyclase domain-containing protein
LIAYSYLVVLLFSIAGLVLLDRRYKLVFWRDRTRALWALAVFMVLFVGWDVAGIMLGIFWHGGSIYALPYLLAPEFPYEELLFLGLLFYTSAELFAGAQAWRRI